MLQLGCDLGEGVARVDGTCHEAAHVQQHRVARMQRRPRAACTQCLLRKEGARLCDGLQLQMVPSLLFLIIVRGKTAQA